MQLSEMQTLTIVLLNYINTFVINNVAIREVFLTHSYVVLFLLRLLF